MRKLKLLSNLLSEYPEERLMLEKLSSDKINDLYNLKDSKIRKESSAYNNEPAAQGLSPTELLSYIASRGLGATQSGARTVATGKEKILPTAGEAMSNAWNSEIMDWTLTSLAAIADFIPGPGILVSIGIAKVQVLKAIVKADWLGVAFSYLSMMPFIGDALGIVGRAIKDGIKLTKEALKALVAALSKVSTSVFKTGIEEFLESMANKSDQYIATIVSNSSEALEKFVVLLRQQAV